MFMVTFFTYCFFVNLDEELLLLERYLYDFGPANREINSYSNPSEASPSSYFAVTTGQVPAYYPSKINEQSVL